MALALDDAKHGRSEMRACCCAMLCRMEGKEVSGRSGQDHRDRDAPSCVPVPVQVSLRPSSKSRPGQSVPRPRIGSVGWFPGRQTLALAVKARSSTSSGSALRATRRPRAAADAANRPAFTLSHGPVPIPRPRPSGGPLVSARDRSQSWTGAARLSWTMKHDKWARAWPDVTTLMHSSQSLSDPCRVHSAPLAGWPCARGMLLLWGLAAAIGDWGVPKAQAQIPAQNGTRSQRSLPRKPALSLSFSVILCRPAPCSLLPALVVVPFPLVAAHPRAALLLISRTMDPSSRVLPGGTNCAFKEEEKKSAYPRGQASVSDCALASSCLSLPSPPL